MSKHTLGIYPVCNQCRNILMTPSFRSFAIYNNEDDTHSCVHCGSVYDLYADYLTVLGFCQTCATTYTIGDYILQTDFLYCVNCLSRLDGYRE